MNKRKAYEEKFAAQLDELNAQVALYKAKADKASAQAKIEYYEITETLQHKHDLAKQKLLELRSSSEDAWETLKAGAEIAWSDVKSATHQAASKFK